MKKGKFTIRALSVFAGFLFVLLVFSAQKSQAADFNCSNLIGDGDFIKIDSMDEGAIQRFLERYNSYLKILEGDDENYRTDSFDEDRKASDETRK